MKYALLLNDMRSPNIENISVIRVSDDKQELIDWYKEQEAEQPWRDGKWGKHFKKGSELEWCNPCNLDLINDYFGGIWVVNNDVCVGYALTKGRR
jgi:hypothetical protein